VVFESTSPLLPDGLLVVDPVPGSTYGVEASYFNGTDRGIRYGGSFNPIKLGDTNLQGPQGPNTI